MVVGSAGLGVRRLLATRGRVVSIRQFAVFGHFDDTVLTPDAVGELATCRSMHVQVMSHGTPLKVRAVVTATTLHKAIAALFDEVARVCPSANATQVNAIEVSINHPQESLTTAS